MEFFYYKTLVFLYIVLTLGCGIAEGVSAENVTNLLNDLLFNSSYNKYVRPVRNQSAVVELSMGFNLISILGFNEIADELTFKGMIYTAWVDEYLGWNPDDYGGTNSINVPSDMIWIPNFVLTSTVEELKRFNVKGDNLQLYSNGTVGWLHADVFKARCLANVQNFPLDYQTCRVFYAGVGYLPTECHLKEGRSFAAIEELDNGQWDRDDVSLSYDGIASTNMPMMIVTIRFHRKYQYMLLNILLPILMLNCLCILVFYIPAESGEKVTYCVTLLLSNTVFLLLLSDNLPKISDPVPNVCIYLIVSMLSSLLICLGTIVNMRIFHRTGEVTRIWRNMVSFSLSGSSKKKKAKNDQICIRNGSVCDQSPSEPRRTGGTNTTQATRYETCTWKDVSRKNDKILFLVFAVIMIVVNITFVISINI